MPYVCAPCWFNSPPGAFADAMPRLSAPRVGSILQKEKIMDMFAVQLAAAVLDDLERVRMANAARYGALTGFTPAGKPWKPDKDGEVRTFGMSPDHADARRFASIVDGLSTLEETAVKALERAMRDHPMGPWVRKQRGLGLKQAGRLLAAVGDPYWRPEIIIYDDDDVETGRRPAGPRTVSALWAYSGLHVNGDGLAVRRKKGVQSNWSTNAKMRAYLCAESCVKQLVQPCHAADFEGRWLAVHYDDCACSPYRVTYDRRKTHTAETQPEWKPIHRHVDALRVASKEILKAMWIEARRLHLELENLPPAP